MFWRKDFGAFVKEQVSRIYQDKLISLYLYGIATEKERKKGVSKPNILIVLDFYNVKDLEEHFKLQKKLVWKYFQKKAGEVKIFTKQELENSLDVFPIEFLEIKESRQLLAGKDILNNYDISPRNLYL
jgi:hypothetical protein